MFRLEEIIIKLFVEPYRGYMKQCTFLDPKMCTVLDVSTI